MFDYRATRFLSQRPSRMPSLWIAEAHAADANRRNIKTCATEFYILHISSEPAGYTYFEFPRYFV
jgi:hypothetical protein